MNHGTYNYPSAKVLGHSSYDKHNYRPEVIEHWGGLNTVDTADKIGFHENPNCLNVRPIGRNWVAPRNGIARIGDEITTPGVITSLYNFRTATQILMRARLTTVERFTPTTFPLGTWTALPGVPVYTTGLRFGFTNNRTHVFFGNGTDNFSEWDGSGAVATYAGNPKGNIFEFYLRRLCVAGISATPATLFYSKIGIPTDFTFSGPRVADDGGSILLGDAGDAITSLRSLITPEGNSSLIVFKRSRRIYAVTFDSVGLPTVKELKLLTGSISHRMTVPFENDIMYADDQNLFQTLGVRQNVQIDLVKEQASSTFANLTPDMTFTNGCGFYFKRQRFMIFSAQTFASTFNDLQFVYYEQYKSWWKWQGMNANQYDEFEDNLVWASASDQNVYFMTEEFDDNGGPITTEFDTKDIDMADVAAGAGFRFKQTRFWYVRGYISEGLSVTAQQIFNTNVNELQEKTFNGTGSVASSPTISLSFGRLIFGNQAFGGFASSPTAFPLKEFFARMSFDLYGFRKARLRMKASVQGTPFLWEAFCPWIELKADEYFPEGNKI